MIYIFECIFFILEMFNQYHNTEAMISAAQGIIPSPKQHHDPKL